MPLADRATGALPAARRPHLLRLATALGAVLALGACSHAARKPTAPAAGDPGLLPEAISKPVHALDFSRFVLNVLVLRWDEDGYLDASWHYQAGTASWTRNDIGYQTVFVGNWPNGTTEVRNETAVTTTAQFLVGGVPQSDLLAADRARLTVHVRQRRYALDPGFDLPDAYDVTTHFTSEFGMDSGSPDSVVATGTLTGWAMLLSGGERIVVTYDGTAAVGFDFPGHFVRCPAEYLTASIRILEGTTERDRYSGTYSAEAEQDLYTGVLESERGPGRYGINASRGCASAAGIRPPDAGASFPTLERSTPAPR